jgi:Bifunctional DNA primase/polymerase, N-terminal
MHINHRSASNTAGTKRHHHSSRINCTIVLSFARADIPVFPCDARKRPLTPRGHHDATANLDVLRRWWTRCTDALIGIPTGPTSGVWVLDVDGEAGRRSLTELITRFGVEKTAATARRGPYQASSSRLVARGNGSRRVMSRSVRR